MQRNARSRPVSQHGNASVAMQPHQSRKIFNCIVDDTALVAGVKKSTRNGIRQWVKNGQIRLFVPLHALDQLSRQKGASNRHGEDVRDTLDWLDDATSKYPHIVTLQGAEETYEKWSEVEQFAVPRSLFSEADHVEVEEDEHSVSNLDGQTAEKLVLSEANLKRSTSSVASGSAQSAAPSSMQSARSSLSAISPPTSPAKPFVSAPSEPASSGKTDAQVSSNGSVHVRLQPLFNYILWRIHQEINPAAALETFIFLCNDPSKTNAAKGFDIRSKRLEQLRDVVGREDREYRNRLSVLSKEGQQQTANTPSAKSAKEPKSPPTAPAAMLGQQNAVMDPDAFSRTVQTPKKAAPATPSSPRAAQNQPGRGANRGNFRGSPRGRGAFPTNPAQGRGGAFPSPSTRRGGGGAAAAATSQMDGQIDPNSFERPRGGFTGRGAGTAGRKLWVPT
ncbi:hypothetical protein Q7P37_007472 [Cladosporium fusiforme]